MKRFLLFLFILFSISVYSQNKEIMVSGIVVDTKENPLTGVTIKVKGADKQQISSNVYGNFALPVPADATLSFSHPNYVTVTIKASAFMKITKVENNATLYSSAYMRVIMTEGEGEEIIPDVADVNNNKPAPKSNSNTAVASEQLLQEKTDSPEKVEETAIVTQNNNVRDLLREGALTLLDEETVSEDADQGDYSVSSLMMSSNNVYVSNTSWNFSAVRFRVRGYDNRYSDMFINGIRFNNLERGGFSYGIVGGLNDATRNKDIIDGLNPSSFTFGQIGGSGNINTHASNYSRGGKVGIAYSNRNYTLRPSVIYSTGLMENGWAVTGSLAYRWANEGFIEGTFYNSLGYLLSVEKVLNPRHSLSFTTLGSPTQRGQQSSSTQEVYDLTGSNYYNAYWGWQDGEKRNSRIVTVYEPVAVLSHLFKINKETQLRTGLGFRYTSYGGTRLDWFNAADPRPDYYREMPSYKTDTLTKARYTSSWRNGDREVTQVDWQRLYEANYQHKISPEKDAGNALYKVEERHNNQQYFSLNSTLNTKLSEHVSLTAGVDASTTKGMHYKTINDLLGAEFFIDIDQFVERDPILKYDPNVEKIKQNDLNNPNRKVKEGERFGYDYNIYVNKANAWVQNVHRYRKIDLHYGFNIGYTEFWREGNMRNGRAPENSYGKGLVHSFVDQGAKLGVIYKLTGRHFFSGNVSYLTLPPLSENSYLSAKIKDNAIPDLKSERVFSADVRYDISTPVVRGGVSVFQTNFYDGSEVSSFYYDAEDSKGYVNYALTGINKTHRGIELGIEAKVNSFITLSLAGTIAEYFYSNRPTGTVSYESGIHNDTTEIVYMKNFYVSGTPQTAGTFGVHLFYKYWFLDINLNGFDRTYVDLTPDRRMASAVANITAYSYEELETEVKKYMEQEKFAGGFTLDVSLGKSFRLSNQHFLNINLQLNNLLNNTDLKTGGYEWGGRRDIDKFRNKYWYAQGINFFCTAALKF